MHQLPKSILFVCTGNICRSPLAEGIFRDIAPPAMQFDSAGLGSWHVGEGPDRRSVAVAARHGVEIGNQVCRMVKQGDFSKFDVILGMDAGHVTALRRLKPDGATAHVDLFMRYCSGVVADVPDPFYGDLADFETVYDMVRAAAENWVSGSARLSSGQDSSIT